MPISGQQLIGLSIVSLIYATPGFAIKCYECESYEAGCSSNEVKKAKTCEGHFCVKVTFRTASASLVRRKCSEIGVEDKCTIHVGQGIETSTCICKIDYCNDASYFRITRLKQLNIFFLSLFTIFITSCRCSCLS